MSEYCNNEFRMVTDTEDAFRMYQGLAGPYFTPHMSHDGTLSWTNNGNLQNPETVSLRGPQGAGIKIAAIIPSEAYLPESAAEGDIWLVGSEAAYEGFSFIDGQWIDLGALTVGPAGPPGPQGDDYELTEDDKAEIAGLAVPILEIALQTTPLPISAGGTGANTLANAKAAFGISAIESDLGSDPLQTEAQNVHAAVNELDEAVGDLEAGKADQVVIAGVEASDTASGSYSAGEYLILAGALYRVTDAITAGDTITDTGAGANVTAVTVGEELTGVRNSLTQLETAATDKVIYLTGLTCSATTGNFCTSTNNKITADHVVAECVFSKPSAITTDVSWTTSNSSPYLALNGTCTDGTCTANVVLIKKDN